MEYERFQEILQDEALMIPEKFYDGLNGGVIISDDIRYSPYDKDGSIYIAGEYIRNSLIGKQIIIYYGSMERLYCGIDEDSYRIKIREVLRHELRHHVEMNAGLHALERWDRENIINILKGKNYSE